MQKGKIIYLNGISGSGKTTLSKTLQERLNEPFYWISSDVFTSLMSPKKFWDIKGHNKAAFDIISLLFHTVKSYSDIGIHTIVDIVHTKYEKDIFEESVRQLYAYPVLFVHVECPQQELYKRKEKRGDPEIDKWLPYQMEGFFPKAPYDITVDTYKNSTEECADQIIALLDYPEKCQAFQTIKTDSFF